RAKQIDKLKMEDLKRSNIARPFMKFEPKQPSGKQTVTIEGLSKAFGESTVIREFSALVQRGEKVCVIGKNGVGKTTLIKMLVGELRANAGKVTWGHQAAIGYLPQDHQGLIPNGTTCFGWLRSLDGKI